MASERCTRCGRPSGHPEPCSGEFCPACGDELEVLRDIPSPVDGPATFLLCHACARGAVIGASGLLLRNVVLDASLPANVTMRVSRAGETIREYTADGRKREPN